MWRNLLTILSRLDSLQPEQTGGGWGEADWGRILAGKSNLKSLQSKSAALRWVVITELPDLLFSELVQAAPRSQTGEVSIQTEALELPPYSKHIEQGHLPTSWPLVCFAVNTLLPPGPSLLSLCPEHGVFVGHGLRLPCYLRVGFYPTHPL